MIRNAITVIKQGRVLTNATVWKKRTIAVNALGALLAATVGILRAFGVDLPLDVQQMDAIALTVVTAVGVFNGWSVAATTETVGMRDRSRANPETRSGNESDTEWNADYRHPDIDP